MGEVAEMSFRRWPQTARRAEVLGLVVVTGLVLAACGSSTPSAAKSSTGSQGAPPAKAHRAAAGGTAVDASSTAQYGTVLVNTAGRTLYMLTADTPAHSACTGTCTSLWHPLTAAGAPRAGHGIDAAKLGTLTGSGGTHQVTYDGHPLYTFSGDTAAGQVRGEGIKSFGGTWYALGTSGQPVTSPVSSTTTTTSKGSTTYY